MSLIIVLRNVSQLADVSDYQYKVLIGDGSDEGSRLIAIGEVEGHTRSDGWQVLVDKLLEKERENDWE